MMSHSQFWEEYRRRMAEKSSKRPSIISGRRFVFIVTLIWGGTRILQILFERAGKIVSRDEIIERLWDSDEFIDDNTLTVNVARLRKKLESVGRKDMIRTKKGIGYMVE